MERISGIVLNHGICRALPSMTLRHNLSKYSHARNSIHRSKSSAYGCETITIIYSCETWKIVVQCKQKEVGIVSVGQTVGTFLKEMQRQLIFEFYSTNYVW